MKYILIIIFLSVGSQYCDAQRYFLKIATRDLTDGESQVNQEGFDLRDFIEIESFTFDISKPYTTNFGGNAGTKPANSSILSVLKPITAKSAKFSDLLHQGIICPEVEIWGSYNIGHSGSPFAFVKYEFKDCKISSLSTGGADSEDQLGEERVGITFAKIKITYQQTNPQTGGKLGNPFTVQWNFNENNTNF